MFQPAASPIVSDKQESRRQRAIAMAVAFSFGITQEDRIFENKTKGLAVMRQPCDYSALKPCNVTERKLEVPKYRFSAEQRNYVPLSPEQKESIVIWEKNAPEGEPHYLLFHGTNGHWGDIWPADNPQARDSGAEFLKQVSDTGAGFTAVSLRGYGRSQGRPSQAAHTSDIQAVVDDMIKQGKPKLIVLGTSLGTWAAVEAAARLTEKGRPPAVLQLVNPFASMVKLGAATINNNKLVRSVGLRMSEPRVAQFLRHPMRSVDRIDHLSPETALCIATSGADEVIDKEHSDILLEAAKKHGLRVKQVLFPGARHADIPSQAVVELSRQAYGHGGDSASNNAFWADEHTVNWSHRIQPKAPDILPGSPIRTVRPSALLKAAATAQSFTSERSR